MFEQYLRLDRVSGNLQYLESIDDPRLTLCDEIPLNEEEALDLDLNDDLPQALKTALKLSSELLKFRVITPEELRDQPFSDEPPFRDAIDWLGVATNKELGI